MSKKHMFKGVQGDGRWTTRCSKGFFVWENRIVRVWNKVTCQHCLRGKK